MKEFCRYTVIDCVTGYALASGEKWKDVSTLNYMCDFRSGFHRRKIREYFRLAQVKSRTCLVVYWVNAPVREEWSFVTCAGVLVGLSGKAYNVTDKPLQLRRLLRTYGL